MRLCAATGVPLGLTEPPSGRLCPCVRKMRILVYHPHSPPTSAARDLGVTESGDARTIGVWVGASSGASITPLTYEK